MLKSDNIWCGQQGGHWGLQGAISCADARPPVAASTGPLTLAGIPSIRSFVAKSTNSRNYRLQWPPWVRMGFKVVNLAPISFGGTKPNGKRLTERGSTLPHPPPDVGQTCTGQKCTAYELVRLVIYCDLKVHCLL